MSPFSWNANSPMKENRIMPMFVPVAILIGCIGLLQWHSIQFWRQQVDPHTGWAWSLLLEAAALWLWYRPGGMTRILGAIASLLLLAGPIYHVGQPVVKAWQSAEHADDARLQTRQLLQTSITALEQRLKSYLATAQKRSGWLPAIARTEAELATARTQLARLYAEDPQATAGQQSTRYFIVAMQLLALVLYQTVGVLAVLSLANRRRRVNVPGMLIPPVPGCAPDRLPLKWPVSAARDSRRNSVH
jgi:nitrogen fixation-related uncharacterized protein